MGDKRECYAGDLMSDMIGKTISVSVGDGVVVQDVLTEVRHVKLGGTRKTWVQFATVDPKSRADGFWVTTTTRVEVLP